MNAVISAQGLTKRYGKATAIDNVSFDIHKGCIMGLIGPNGSGKTTTLKAILGLVPFDGELSVLGLDPRTQRNELMKQVTFIADVAVLPRWIQVRKVVEFVAGVHPSFDRQKAERYIAATKLKPSMKVNEMSKGMVVQLHLALIMSINAKVLVLDEPTLGLDIIYRRQFYRSLLEDYFDQDKTIIVSTHQIEEIENVITDLMFMKDGRIFLRESMDSLAERFTEIRVSQDQIDTAIALRPIDTRNVLGQTTMLFDGVPRDQLQCLGEVRVPQLADLFVTTLHGAAA